MASLRSHIWIDRPADEVWQVAGDFGGVSAWVPGVECSVDGETRTLKIEDRIVTEDLVTHDDALRRFQYRIRTGVPVDHHLGTIDVLADGERSLVVYSTEIEPDSLAPMIGPAIESNLGLLKTHIERG
jgi:hypothetical protein